MDELRQRIAVLYCHLQHAEAHANNGQLEKAEHHINELAERARLLRAFLFGLQRVSGEVKN